jgi:hypothetical protein
MKIEKSDRRLLTWAALVLLPLIVALAFLSQEEQESSVPSTYSAQTHGAKAAYLLLENLGYTVERWRQSPTGLPSDPAGTVLLLASPYRPPLPEEKSALQLYLSRGGKIVITGASPWMYLPRADVDPEPLPAPKWREYQPQLLTPLTSGGMIQMSPVAYWKDSSTAFLVHYADEGRPVVISYKIGNGDVIWWGASTPLTNAAIAQSGNLALLLNSLGQPGRVHVFWDEYFHGDENSFIHYLAEKPMLFGILQFLLVFMALLLTFSRRNGPVHPLPEPSRLSPLEFVHTLGKLYHRAGAIHSALAVPYTRFRTLATRQLGVNSDLPACELARALKGRFRHKHDQLDELLQQIEAALHNPQLSESTALELAQRLADYTQSLKQENIAHADSLPRAVARTN